LNDRYWEAQHRRGGLRSVGQSGLSEGLNRWLYRTGERTLTRVTRGIDLSRIFEAGAGTGYWTSYWLARGSGSVDGCDLVPVAVERLNERFRGRGTFVVADLAGEPPPVPGSYTTVTAMNVLLHIRDEDAFDRALANLARLVAQGGHLLIADPVLLAGRPVLADTSRTRPLDRYVDVLRGHGLELADLAPTTVLGADPIEARGRWERRVSRGWWRLVKAADRRRLGSVAGLAIYLLDPIALMTGWAPTGKFLLFRRPTAVAAG
jgi:SAM-dependent methyltransferase